MKRMKRFGHGLGGTVLTLVVVGLALFGVAVGLLVSVDGQPGLNFRLELSKGLISFASALLITGGVAQMLNLRAQHRTDARAEMDALASILRELKAAYEQMAVARTHLRANTAALTFSQQLERIADCRTRLQHIERDPIVEDQRSGDLGSSIAEMVKFTRGATKVYVKNGPTLTKQALIEQRAREHFLRDPTKLTLIELPEQLDLRSLQPADFLSNLLADDDEWDALRFRKAYSTAKAEVRRLYRVAKERA